MQKEGAPGTHFLSQAILPCGGAPQTSKCFGHLQNGNFHPSSAPTINLVALGSGSPWGITASPGFINVLSEHLLAPAGSVEDEVTESIELGFQARGRSGDFPAPGQGEAVKALKFMAGMRFPTCAPPSFPGIIQ